MSLALVGQWYRVNDGQTLTVRAVRKGKSLALPIPEGMYVLFQGDRLICIAQPDEYEGFAVLYASQDAINAACTTVTLDG